MSKVKMISQPVPNVPWQDKPKGRIPELRYGDTARTLSLAEIR